MAAAEMSLGAVGFGVWLILAVVAFRYCSGWRSRGWVYGLSPIALLLWILPNAVFGSSDAKGAGLFIGIYGFWVAAVYLAFLLAAELIKVRGAKADS
jgi:hypothetical protein